MQHWYAKQTGASPAEQQHSHIFRLTCQPIFLTYMTSVINLPSGYMLRDGYPSVPDYVHLRSIAGLSPKTTSQAAVIATGSWYGCYITFEDDPQPVGMGRIIGDGGW
jgi:hypothetical protein